jgi:hypothetical protein
MVPAAVPRLLRGTTLSHQAAHLLFCNHSAHF